MNLEALRTLILIHNQPDLRLDANLQQEIKMKLISSLIAIVAATGKYATSDDGSDCITGWTKVTGQNQCDPPASFTSGITCNNDGMKFNLKPSHVFDDFSRIPNDVLSTLSVDIAGSSAVYKKIITFRKLNTVLL